MKTKIKVFIFLGLTFLILAFMMILPVIILNKSWWWFWGTLIFASVSWFIVGGVIVIKNMMKPIPVKQKLDLKDAEAKAIHEMMYDEHNPDNFKIEKRRLERWGERGSELTPIFILEGIGTEKDEKRVVVINLNNPSQESTRLLDPTEREIERAIIKISETIPDEPIVENITSTLNFGVPTTTMKRTIPPGSAKAREEEEKKQLEEKTAM